MEKMTTPRNQNHTDTNPNENTIRWPQPIFVFGYDDVNFGSGLPAGDPFEAETTCVKRHNLGQVATQHVNNLSF
jgi:hypothetical protein